MNYISSEELYAEIREEMSSYFNTGAVDDILFPRWTIYCIKRFKKSTMQIEATTLDIKNYKADLPKNFDSARSVWSCNVNYVNVMSPQIKYHQHDIRLTEYGRCDCPPELPCECDPCKKDKDYQVTYKSSGELLYSFRKSQLLTPSGVRTKNRCTDNCLNFRPTTEDTFEIDGCHLYTSIPEGKLYIEYYAENMDEEGNVMIPDNIYVQQYIMAYIRYKLFKKLLDSTTDESFNQMNYKYQEAKRDRNEAFIHAEIELKKKTPHKLIEFSNRNRDRFSRVRRAYR